MYIKIEDNIIVGRSSQKLEGYIKEDVSSQEYLDCLAEQEKQKNKAEIKTQIDELDKKRIRAMVEPSIKDKDTGETWLDYYNKLIKDLREQLE